jgi:hypothetical protein
VSPAVFILTIEPLIIHGILVIRLINVRFRNFVERAKCREWRSEALLAMTSRAEFKLQQAVLIDNLSKELADTLSVVMIQSSNPTSSPKPRNPNAGTQLTPMGTQEVIKRDIIIPAVQLAHDMQLALKVYRVDWPFSSAGKQQPQQVDLSCVDYLNVDDGKVLDTSSSPSRYTYAFDVLPGLWIEAEDDDQHPGVVFSQKPLVLVRPKSRRAMDHENGDDEDGKKDDKAVVASTIFTWLLSGQSNASNANGLPKMVAAPAVKNEPRTTKSKLITSSRCGLCRYCADADCISLLKRQGE